MGRSELKKKLDLLGVNPSYYSLEGDLGPDRIVLYNSYDKWDVFYQDERGGRHDKRIFSSEGEACDHVHDLFLKASR